MIVRTRFAPSPTGFVHIGNVRTALYAFLFAKKNNGKFILRIEDTDQERFVLGATAQIIRTLKLAGLKYDEGPDIGGQYGPYIQTQRKEFYQKAIQELLEKDKAYYCFCAKERLLELRQSQENKKEAFRYDRHCREILLGEALKRKKAGEFCVVRQKVPLCGVTSYHDQVYGEITFENKEIDDGILVKSDGIPVYNFAVVVDDHFMEISHVIRGSEFLSSTPKHVLLYESLGWKLPFFIHLPVIMKDAHKKLSKRDGDATFEELFDKGYIPEAIVNYIALLGWHPKTEQEIFSLEELIKEFSLEGLSKNPAIFDPKKIDWMNGEYIRAMSLEKFHERSLPYYKETLGELSIDFLELSKLLHERIIKFSDISSQIHFFKELSEYSQELFVKEKMKSTLLGSKDALEKIKEVLKGISLWNEKEIRLNLENVTEKMSVKNGVVYWPLRIALSGKEFTPGGATEIATILGKEETLNRIDFALKKLDEDV